MICKTLGVVHMYIVQDIHSKLVEYAYNEYVKAKEDLRNCEIADF